MTTSPQPLPKIAPGSPAMPQSSLHPDSNKAAAMAPTGDWMSYSEVPTLGEAGWQKKEHSICFRIPPSRAPEWKGDWKDSLIVFEAEPGSSHLVRSR